MPARQQTRKKQTKWVIPVIAGIVIIAALAIAIIIKHFKEATPSFAEGYVASATETASVYDEEGNELTQMPRGTAVLYVMDEPKNDDDPVRIALEDAALGYLPRENFSTDINKVVTTKEVYVKRAVNLLDKDGIVPGELATRGQALSVVGYGGLQEDGSVMRYQVDGGYIAADNVCLSQDAANAPYDKDLLALHTARGDSYGGGDAKDLDYYPCDKPKFEGNVMPDEVKALYLNVESVTNAAAYVDIANNCGINAFVVDIMDGGAIGYASPTMQEYSPSAYANAYNTAEEYKQGIATLKNAGYYVIGRITTFNDPNLAIDHPELLIADTSGNPLEVSGMYWPSVYNRNVWQYKVNLALEAVEMMGFNEIQFDYCRFPDGTWSYEDAGTIDFRNTYNESKAQAVQRFLQYAATRLHNAGVYISADVFGECAENYVTAYGQYWPAISAAVDAISAMPYPDHYPANGDYLPWEHPYDTMSAFGAKAAQRQTETVSPGAVRTWIQAYDAIWEPYNTYGPDEVGAEIRALHDTGNMGGYMTWNGASPVAKYNWLSSVFK